MPPRTATVPPLLGPTIVQKTDMVATVLENMRERIIAGAFGADGPLPPEGDLATDYGVSRTVIREAMRSLRAQGLVEVAQGKLPRVKPPAAETVIASLLADPAIEFIHARNVYAGCYMFCISRPGT